jgi:hypothetical protein
MSVPNGTLVRQETNQQSNHDTFKPSICQNRNYPFPYHQSKHHVQQALHEKKQASIIEIDSDDNTDDGEKEDTNKKMLADNKEVII